MKKLLTLLVLCVASCTPLPAQNTLAGNLTVQQSVKFTGDITPPQLTADVDDYAPASFSAATFLRVASDAPRVITGLAGGADGRIGWLSNIGGYPISLAHAFTGSAAANRFDLGGANYELAAGNGLGLWYDATAARWRPLSGLAAGGGGGGTGTVTSVAVTTANGVSAAVTNAASVAAPLIEGSARIAVPMILTKNPQLVDDFALSASAAATILATSNPTAEGFSVAVRVAFPEVTQAQATQIGAALESAYSAGAALFKAQTGKDLVLTSIIADPEYKAAADALVTALVRGVSNGLADYRASLPTT